MNQNLLILGAGQYSYVVREIAEAMGCFSKVDLLDDNNPAALARLKDFPRFVSDYAYAAVSIGSNHKRLELLEELQRAGFNTPALIHPRAYVSASAKIGPGSIVEPFAVVQANVNVGTGCILSATTVINHNAVLENGAHCDCGSVITARALVPQCSKVKCGMVFYTAVPDTGDAAVVNDYNADVGI